MTPTEIPQSPRILVVDIETTGVDPERNSIIEIGAIWFGADDQNFSERCHMWPEAIWTAGAAKVNGEGVGSCRSKAFLSEAKVMVDFVEWLTGESDYRPVILAGLNPDFDRRFLLAAGRRAKLDLAALFPHRLLDLHSVAVMHALSLDLEIPVGGFRTDEIYELLDMPGEPKPHQAFRGARHELAAFRELLTPPREYVPPPAVDEQPRTKNQEPGTREAPTKNQEPGTREAPAAA